jgi:CheY-like chemotaxis protein
MALSTSTSLDHPVRILLVDDNSHGLAARRSVLQELGYAIVTAVTVKEALLAFAREAFDLVITDYKLPDMDGLKLIEEIRAKAPSLPVILISGFVDTLGLDEKATGADAVIQKSSHEVNHLVRAVNRLVKRGSPRKPAIGHRPAIKTKRRSG